MTTQSTVSGQAPRRGSPLRWVFLDRDGTLNEKPVAGEYVERPEELRLLTGAADAVRMLNRGGLWTGVVTNQRGVALGRMGPADLDAVHRRLIELLQREGASLDAIYACPHGIDECECRKPSTGLLLKAKADYPTLDFGRAAIVGDSYTDMEAGRRLGLITVLLSESGCDSAAAGIADHVVANPLQAAEVLTAAPRRFRRGPAGRISL